MISVTGFLRCFALCETGVCDVLTGVAVVCLVFGFLLAFFASISCVIVFGSIPNTSVRLPQNELNTIREDAELAGISMSELVRRRYFGRPIIANTDAVMGV
ncbi:ribbon-helix-helix domain-containing protein [Rhodoferax antarcticus]|uniref:ribbon-helix-helix domain-containing protein n=1 Tax=Rhodoferax antarcticus TaxID=81479 RepID=UPI0022253807|nr:ribbon-helix-helix domain-containing protein [Rhodoferax antarcticus]MCW2314067.1 hypothetical protein [Rhodoferax antarcticus]